MSDSGGVGRRDVLKAGGVVAAAGALGIGGSNVLQTLTGDGTDSGMQLETFVGEDEVVQTVCSPNCRGKCPIDVYKRGGRIKKIQPHVPEDERYKRGCLLGLTHTQRVYDPTRLKYPMKRTDWSLENPNPKGRGFDAEFERISWDKALSLLASKLQTTKRKKGAERVLWHGGSGNQGNLGGMTRSRLASLFGGVTDAFHYGIDTNVGQGFDRVAGNLADAFLPPSNAPTDWKNCETMIAWGTDLFRSQFEMDAEHVLETIRDGGKFVVVDPVYTATASKADLWLPIAPGKDTLLALSMMQVIFEEGLHDDEFLRKRSTAPALVRTDTGDLLQPSDVFANAGSGDAVAMNTRTGQPEQLSAETGGPYALFGTHKINGIETKTALTLLKEHVSQYTPEATAGKTRLSPSDVRTAARWLATRGPGGILPSYGIGRYMYGHVFGQAYATLMGLTGDYGNSGNIHTQHGNIWGGNQELQVGEWASPPSDAPNPTLGYKDDIAAIENGRFDVIYAMESNMLANQFPDRQRSIKALKNVDMIAWADMHHTPSVQYSDLILPVAHWFEQEDIITPANHPHITYRHKVQEPLWEAKSDYWILSRLAKRLGFGDAFVGDAHKELKGLVVRDDRLDFDKLDKQGTVAMDYETVMYEDEFGTDTGRLELYDDSGLTESGPGLDGEVSLELPKPIEARTSEDYEKADEYPLMFMQKHGVFRIHSQYEMNSWVREINTEPHLDINPSDANARNIADGEYVRVHNDKGEMVVKAKYNDGMQPGLINTDQGWWNRDFVKGHINDLTDAEVGDIGRTFAFYDTRVEVEPAPDDLDTEGHLGDDLVGSEAQPSEGN
ncbi:molybdopterin-dependent oxidoreductase [Halococcus thailandensis]|uniref:Dimethylsulfoxide reductase n=1 Tax=Halococcus thailandensis JCM 13552 TaxID=1227457 RepID=M0NDN4_9EURY|nr:molybdopterin-dependent oxidoreductase [Halococcus thailandensis]EMA56072.1 dimethylsulfoxide reductase [Halococcus thailandensis JCM 13552]